MEKRYVIQLLEGIMNEHGIPKNIKDSINESVGILDRELPEDEKLSHIITVLDDAVADPNISCSIRTNIWNTVSVLESL